MDTQQSWNRSQILRVLSVTERQLRSWEQMGLIPALEQYSLRDLIALRTLNSLRENKIPVGRIKRSFVSLRERLRHVANPFMELKIFTDGKQVRVQMAGHKMEAISGQLLLDFDAQTLEKLRAFPRPESPQRSEEERRNRAEADHWFQQGLEAEQTGAPIEDAIAAYAQAVKLNPQAAGAFVNLGTIYFHQRQWKRAEDNYRRAVEADPEYALAQFNLGNLYDERGERQLALEHYRAALRLSPQYADVHYNMALLYQASGDVMQAVQHWSLYLKLDPASQWSRVARRELSKLKQATLIPGARAAAARGAEA